MGLMPVSRYSFMVSWEMRALSFEYLRWMAWSLGCKSDILLVDRICRRVSGSVRTRTNMVKTMMVIPKFLPRME